MALIYDVETNGLLDTLDRVHCLSIRDTESGQHFQFRKNETEDTIEIGGGDRLETQVYTLKFTSANQLMPVLRPIISPNNTIAAFPSANALVITDYGANLRRIERIIEAIDKPGGGDPMVIPLRYAAAADVIQTLNRVLSDSIVATAGQAGAIEPSLRVYLASDPRTNSIVVRTENPARASLVQSMVQQLDVRTRTAANVHDIYLKNAEAVRVAQTLRGILAGESSPAPAPAQAAGAQAASAQPAGAQGGGMVQADPASNALLISAPDAIFAHIKAIVEKLDVRRAHVYVEGLIVEISAEKAAEFGIQWQSFGDVSNPQSRVSGGTNFRKRCMDNAQNEVLGVRVQEIIRSEFDDEQHIVNPLRENGSYRAKFFNITGTVTHSGWTAAPLP